MAAVVAVLVIRYVILAILFTPSRNGATPSMDADAALTLQIRAAVER